MGGIPQAVECLSKTRGSLCEFVHTACVRTPVLCGFANLSTFRFHRVFFAASATFSHTCLPAFLPTIANSDCPPCVVEGQRCKKCNGARGRVEHLFRNNKALAGMFNNAKRVWCACLLSLCVVCMFAFACGCAPRVGVCTTFNTRLLRGGLLLGQDANCSLLLVTFSPPASPGRHLGVFC